MFGSSRVYTGSAATVNLSVEMINAGRKDLSGVCNFIGDPILLGDFGHIFDLWRNAEYGQTEILLNIGDLFEGRIE